MAYFALVPAAGGGTRMGADCPKQYMPLAGYPVIRHALTALVSSPIIDHVYVVLAPDDRYWDTFDWGGLVPRLSVLRCGGDTRAASVTNGLRRMGESVAADDWVLVHDAARACLSSAHLERLIREVGDDAVGGLLAVPLADTLKRGSDDDRVAATVPREKLWQAQTPQMFRYSLLRDAMEYAPVVTDEASAVEMLGLRPRLVTADVTNLKVTYPLDLQLAEWILKNRKD